MQKDRTYVCIDLKSFYASVECRERGLDPIAGVQLTLAICVKNFLQKNWRNR